MSSTVFFQLKKVFKSNLTLISISVLAFITLGLYFMVSNSLNSDTSLEGSIQGNIKIQKSILAQGEKELKKYSPGSKNYQAKQKDVKNLKNKVQANLDLITDIKHNNWRPVYKKQLASFTKLNGTNLSYQEKYQTEAFKKRFAYLKEHPMPYESDAPVTGVQALLTFNTDFWPLLFSLIIMFILAYLYTDSYRNKLDIDSVTPQSPLQRLLASSAAGFTTSIIIFCLVSLFLFLIASLLYGPGNIQYPYIIFHSIHQKFVSDVVPTSSLLFKNFIVQIFSFLFIALFVQLVAKLVRQQLPTLLIVLFLMIGGSLATTFIEPLSRIAAWLPSTYLGALKVVSGQMANELNNPGINFNQGIVTLTVGTLLLIMILLLMDQLQKQRTGAN